MRLSSKKRENIGKAFVDLGKIIFAGFVVGLLLPERFKMENIYLIVIGLVSCLVLILVGIIIIGD